MSRVVIFGGSGFIGQSLLPLLGEYVAPGDDLTLPYSREYVRSQVKDGDSIVMLSALTNEHGHGYDLTDMNIRMATNVIAGTVGKDIAHCVYVSSDSVYEKVKGVMDETTNVMPDTLYGHMHALREMMFRERFPSLTIFRPCAIYGVDDTHNAYGINQFVRSAKDEGVIELFGGGEECRSNVHVDDVAAVIAKAVTEKINGVFNVNCGKAYPFWQIADMVKHYMGGNVEIRSKPRTMPVMHRLVDNSKLAESFFAPRLAEEGIRELVAQTMGEEK